jgi:hypothetical protein
MLEIPFVKMKGGSPKFTPQHRQNSYAGHRHL